MYKRNGWAVLPGALLPVPLSHSSSGGQMVFLCVNQISFTHWRGPVWDEMKRLLRVHQVERALPRPWLLPHVLSYPLSCDFLATLARACIALPVWSASTLILLQPHHDFIQVSILSHIQTVRIATSEITALSWFLPFNLLLFPFGSQPCTDTAFSTVSVPYWCVCYLVPAFTPDFLTSVCIYPRTSTW